MWYIKAKSVEKGKQFPSREAIALRVRRGGWPQDILLSWGQEGLANVRPVVSFRMTPGPRAHCHSLGVVQIQRLVVLADAGGSCPHPKRMQASERGHLDTDTRTEGGSHIETKAEIRRCF